MDAEEEQVLLNNQNDTNYQINIINNSYSKIKLEIDTSTNEFKTTLPIELFQFISSQDFYQIINQFNHFKRGFRFKLVYIGTVLFFMLCFIFSVIFVRARISSSFFIIFVPIIIGLFVLCFAFNIYRVNKNFHLGIELYIEAINKLYPNLKFEGIFYKNKSFSNTLRGIEIIVVAPLVKDSIQIKVPPPSIYNSSQFIDSNRLSYDQLFGFNQGSTTLHLNNDIISSTTNIHNHNHINHF